MDIYKREIITSIEEDGTLINGLWECKIVQSLENSLEVPQIIKYRLPYDLAIPLLGV